MDNKEWFEAGEKIGDLVQAAVDSSNYQALNESISKVIEDTLKAVQTGISGQSKMADKAKEDIAAGRSYRAPGTAWSSVSGGTDSGKTKEGGLKKKSSGRLASRILGISMTVVFGSGFLLTLLMGMIRGGLFLAPTLILAALTAGSAWYGFVRPARSGLEKRLETYLNVMGTRDTCTFKELAAGSGQSEKQVRKDVKKGIRKGLFAGEAYIDAEETCLMTSHAAYRQYVDTMSAARVRDKERREAEQRRREAEKDLEKYSDETRKILQEGKDFITHIHECNEKIPDAEMSEKLDRLEQVVSRIFAQVEKNPDSAPDLHKMMNYYIPVTRKLLDAYVELEDVSQDSGNVRRTREEIEMSIDTINTAFETFLDDFFADTAWDISSDISVLKTMMARDGLTGRDDFAPAGQTRSAPAEGASTVNTGAGAAAAAAQAEEMK